MHTKPMGDDEGDFGKTENTKTPCQNCACNDVTVRAWDSSCGGYTDYKYRCRQCGHTWWVEGADA